MLPPARPFVRCEAVLAEEEKTAWAEDSCDLGKCARYIWDRTERICEDNRIDGVVWDGNVLGGGLEELDWEGRALRGFLCQSPHFPRRIERPEMVNLAAVVEGQVQPRAKADIENVA